MELVPEELWDEYGCADICEEIRAMGYELVPFLGVMVLKERSSKYVQVCYGYHGELIHSLRFPSAKREYIYGRVRVFAGPSAVDAYLIRLSRPPPERLSTTSMAAQSILAASARVMGSE